LGHWDGEDPRREDKHVEGINLGGREMEEVRLLEPGGIRD